MLFFQKMETLASTLLMVRFYNLVVLVVLVILEAPQEMVATVA
jgi:hypothetical protein